MRKLVSRQGLVAVAVIVALVVAVQLRSGESLLSSGGLLASGAPGSSSTSGGSHGGAEVSAGPNGINVGQAYQHDESQPLRSLPPLRPKKTGPPRADQNENQLPINGHQDQQDPVVQRSLSPSGAPAPATLTTGTAWDGINFNTSYCNCAPPDTNGQVGSTQYVQTVNSAFAVYSKTGTGTPLYGPAAINTIWTGFGGPCELSNDGDPIVLYDQLAQRWLISQFTATSPYNECIAISTTSDATGSYYRYAFQLSTTDFPDYPHLAVWPDGYYMTVNWFANGTTYGGPRPYVFDRTSMLSGLPANYQTTSGPLGANYNPMLPSDLDGSTLPPAGSPNIFAENGSAINLYAFHTDWTTPANTSFTRRASLAVAGFTQLCPSTRSCIPQPGTVQGLDGLGDRFMHRLAYRNFGSYQSLVVNHSVDVGGGQSGVRWYEIRDPLGTPALYQQGTYAPGTDSRWMASVAMDKFGDLAAAYSVSSSTTYPSLSFAGRTPSDPLGTFGQAESSLFAGTGSQTSPDRWGDYSSLTVDPTDDCTFWYTSEYYSVTSSFNWQTRIGTFRFPSCAGGAPPTATAVPPTSTPVPGATSTPIPPTSTPSSVPTNTPVPVATNTPVPAPTSTPVPVPTPCDGNCP